MQAHAGTQIGARVEQRGGKSFVFVQLLHQLEMGDEDSAAGAALRRGRELNVLPLPEYEDDSDYLLQDLGAIELIAPVVGDPEVPPYDARTKTLQLVFTKAAAGKKRPMAFTRPAVIGAASDAPT